MIQPLRPHPLPRFRLPAKGGIGAHATRTFLNIRAGGWWRVLLAMLCWLVALPAAAQDFPKFTGLVVDAANVIPDDREAALRTRLEQLQQSTKRQLVVATVPSLGGDDVDDYANRLFRAWGIGLNGADNGVLLLVAPAEHKVRIEVGYGLEPIVTDALSGTIIADDITPRFKAGDLPGGIEAGVNALATQLALPDDEARAKVADAETRFNAAHRRRTSGGGIPVGLVFWGVILLFVVLPMLGRRRQGWTGQRWGGQQGGSTWPIVLWGVANALGSERRGGWGGGSSDGGGWSGGGGSDGSWGGGGFTGGGGGSSGGGGASGGW